MKRVNDQGNTLYLVTLKDNTKTRFWFMNDLIIEEVLNSYNIPYEKIECNKKYEWKPEQASEYWRNRK